MKKTPQNTKKMKNGHDNEKIQFLNKADRINQPSNIS